MHSTGRALIVVRSKRVGFYLRVSTSGQTVENQRQDLERVAQQRGWQVADVYVDHGISGAKSRDKRPAFDRMCQDAARGKLDVVASWSIDRLGRSLSHVASFMDEMLQQNVALYLHQQQVDGTTSSGKAMLGMAAVFAEFERSCTIDRINAGLARARAEGKQLGRPRVDGKVEDKIRTLRKAGAGKLKIAKQLGVGVSTVQRVLSAARTS
jgi:DNA invertase Pin-like site-specific DNA recombinase